VIERAQCSRGNEGARAPLSIFQEDEAAVAGAVGNRTERVRSTRCRFIDRRSGRGQTPAEVQPSAIGSELSRLNPTPVVSH
jgi:hypothetical protein